jgi:carotenoid cleavage dioxygenase
MDDEKGTGTSDVYFAGPTCTFQEPTFIPRTGGEEGEGYLIALLNHLDVLRNDVVIFDAQNMAKGPVATIHLPLKLKLGLHGNFVDHRDIEAWRKRRADEGDVGPVKVATEPLPWQKKFMEETGIKIKGVTEGKVNGEKNGEKKTNGTNGVVGQVTEALTQAVLGAHGHDP